MSRVCYYTGKKPIMGKRICRRGIAKKKGGIGLKTTGIAVRRFLPNLQTVKILENGTVKKIRVAASYLKTGKVIRAPKRTWKKPAITAPAGLRPDAASSATKAPADLRTSNPPAPAV